MRPSISGRNMIRQALLLSLTMTIVGLFTLNTQGLIQAQTREIVSDDFTKNRQKATPQTRSQGSSGARTAASKTRRTYRLASPTATKIALSRTSVWKQLGITVWRLRPATSADKGPTVTVNEESAISQWVPERVQADTRFREGDRVRLSIESPGTGYLYVVDRDLFSDGTMGDPLLIYPWAEKENLVRPGLIVDIPAQEDNPSFFTARTARKDQVGEVLTFILSKTALGLPISGKPLPISRTQLAQWEKMWTAQSERFEMNGGAGEPWTSQEQGAASKIAKRQLTRDDPAPQTIYRIANSNRIAFLVTVRLTYEGKDSAKY